MKKTMIWKYVAALALVALYILGIKTSVPDTRNYDTIRNVYFHVPMWFVMMILFTIGVVASLRYLRTFDKRFDMLAYASSTVGTLFGVLGLCTGMVWASATWGSAWNNDPKQVGAAIALLGYFAYLILRRSVRNEEVKARVAAIYNVFAYFILFPTIWILPRMSESLHPGGISDQAEVTFDPDNLTLHMRLLMWLLAVPAWFLVAWWIVCLQVRWLKLKQQLLD